MTRHSLIARADLKPEAKRKALLPFLIRWSRADGSQGL